MVDLDGVVARVRVRPGAGGRAIGESDLLRALATGRADLAGRAVLIDTGHSEHWGTPAYFAEHPYLTDDAVEFLLSVKPALVGIDSLNIDSTHTGRRPAHSWLLAARIPIVEHLTGLDELPDSGFPIHRRAAGGARDGHLPGAGLRRAGRADNRLLPDFSAVARQLLVGSGRQLVSGAGRAGRWPGRPSRPSACRAAGRPGR